MAVCRAAPQSRYGRARHTLQGRARVKRRPSRFRARVVSPTDVAHTFSACWKLRCPASSSRIRPLTAVSCSFTYCLPARSPGVFVHTLVRIARLYRSFRLIASARAPHTNRSPIATRYSRGRKYPLARRSHETSRATANAIEPHQFGGVPTAAAALTRSAVYAPQSPAKRTRPRQPPSLRAQAHAQSSAAIPRSPQRPSRSKGGIIIPPAAISLRRASSCARSAAPVRLAWRAVRSAVTPASAVHSAFSAARF